MSARSAVFLSHTHRHGDFVVGSHHLAREFARMGWRVAHVSTPFSLAHRVTGRGARGRRESAERGPTMAEDGVLDFVPSVVLPAPVCSPRRIHHVLAEHGFASPDVVLLDQPKLARLAVRLRRGGVVVYRPTDVYTGSVARRFQEDALRAADMVVATSAPVLESLGGLAVPAVVIPNGVEFGRFAEGETGTRAGVIYVGALDSRFAWGDLADLASHYADVPFRIHGPAPRGVPELPANVRLLGPLEYSDVPGALARAKVGLLPLTDLAENAGRSPMKLYEYLAAGLHVLATSTPVTEALAPLVHTYGSSGDAVALLGELLSLPSNTEGEVAARTEDWSAKAREIVRFALGG